MAWEDRKKNQLIAIAEEHGVAIPSGDSATKAEIIEALIAAGVSEPTGHEVSGPQPAPVVPNVPITREDFAQLVENPDLPPQNQSAPGQDRLNPHLFPQR